MDNFFFDFDNTLADSSNVAVVATQRAYQARNLAIPTRAAIVDYMGVPIEVSFAKMAQETLSVAELAALFTEFRQQYQQAERAGMTIFPGMATTIDALKTQGKQLFVASSKHSVPLQRNLEQIGLGQSFTAICGSDMVAHYKPAPDGILNLLKRFDLDPQRSVMIGDAKYDIQMGRRAGVATAGAMWGAADPVAVKEEQPIYVLATPAALLNL
ncbi:HAD family hydrolase [Levilactobacillus tujiorum]|uniref:HAD-IA family hydrolase n=1 Tax=Levilactobacillus tujiorum TaxID=2912243 RepID=A0ABX1L3C6_9LACO|nr:HAD-IA family hydrolase [Levilactobacillus tujiorum]MCH5464551.1 HAD-IA family hydrolase [Levilactobacillus tujiorum]NLR11751.1 HAD-IA family hydrolase [Lactobacillus sp. HBUAS51387]NLR29531.1 HAD-IA family hydrolase [Levilactobacillus tujiorum]